MAKAREPTTTKTAAAGAASYAPEPAPAIPEAEYVIEGKGGDKMAGGGWVRLGDEKKVPADERASEDMAIEMTETTSRGNTVGAAGAVNGAGDAGGQSTNLGATGPGEYKVYKRRWFGLVQLVLLNIMASWSWLTFSPVATHSARYFGTDETTVNWLSTAFVFANAAVSPIVIYVLHLGPKLSIMTSAILLLIGSWIRFAGSNSSSGGILSVVMFGQILTGMAQGFVLCAPTRYSDLWFTTRGRVAATALASLANPFGAALGQLIIPFWVTSPGDISRMVLYVSIISTVVALPSFFIPAKPPTPAAPSSTTPKLSLRASASILIRQLEFWLLFIPFATYVALFNSVSSLLNQIMAPYGYNEEESGIAGALLIVVGLVTAAIASPIIDRTKAFLTAIRIAVPLIGLSLLIFIWMPETRPSGGVAGPYVTMALLGASAFSLVPVAVEFLVELTHPVSPEVTSTLAWGGGQVGGGVFIIISGALKDGEAGDPPFNMKRALIFSAVVALVAVVPPMCLGLFGRGENVRLRRVRSDLDLGRHGIDE